MKRLAGAAIFALSISLLPSTVLAASRGTQAEAVAMVKKALAMIKASGKPKTYAAIADPANKTFHDRDLYIFIYNLNGVVMAHGNNPKMVGQASIGLLDNEGKPMIKQMVEIATTKGKGWLYYKWPNPVTREVETKSAYVERIDDILVGSGAYQ